MAKKKVHPLAPEARPQRTREHVIADLSMNFVERFIFEAGHSVMRVPADYGYDLLTQTFDEQGYAEEGFISLQLKATDSIGRFERAESFSFPLEMRHCNLWRRERLPVYFILYDAPGRRAYWVHVQAYLAAHAPQRAEAQSFTVNLSKKNVLGKGTIEKMRQAKAKALAQPQGGAGS